MKADQERVWQTFSYPHVSFHLSSALLSESQNPKGCLTWEGRDRCISVAQKRHFYGPVCLPALGSEWGPEQNSNAKLARRLGLIVLWFK